MYVYVNTGNIQTEIVHLTGGCSKAPAVTHYMVAMVTAGKAKKPH